MKRVPRRGTARAPGSPGWADWVGWLAAVAIAAAHPLALAEPRQRGALRF